MVGIVVALTVGVLMIGRSFWKIVCVTVRGINVVSIALFVSIIVSCLAGTCVGVCCVFVVSLLFYFVSVLREGIGTEFHLRGVGVSDA